MSPALINETEEQALPAQSVATKTERKISRTYLIGKRCFDLLSSFVVSLILLLPMVIVAAIIVIKDPGNPFYMQRRVGMNGKELKILKFRSMKVGADRLEEMLTPEQLEEYKREYKLRDDPRLIGYKKAGDGSKCFGALIRRTSIDELPQIPYNIFLRGNMSVVGPRPILQDELENNYTAQEQQRLLAVKPGLTGYWQANARNNATYETGERQSMELYYTDHCSAMLDLKIIIRTFTAVLKKEGAN